MRIVLDTNVVMSALLWRGPPYRLLEAIRQRTRLQLYSSIDDGSDETDAPAHH